MFRLGDRDSRIYVDQVYRVVSRLKWAGETWLPERAADGKVRAYPLLRTARSVRSQLEKYGLKDREYKIQVASEWKDVE